MHPVKNNVYSLHTIVNVMELEDCPSLNIIINGVSASIQNAHFTWGQLLEVQGWSELKFTFIRTTHEWVPIFNIIPADNDKVLELVSHELVLDSNSLPVEGQYWVVPKAFPREQYYAKVRRELYDAINESNAGRSSGPISVVDDVHVGDNKWRIEFNDGSEVVIRDNFNTTPPTYDRVNGVFAANQIAAIEKWSALKVNS